MSSEVRKGKLIVLYGINNLGKTTQAKLIVERLEKLGRKVQYLKYPIYDLEPTGPKINEMLRGGKKQNISEIEFQSIYAQNRQDYQPKLIETLNNGIDVVAEDYTGTGIAWGITKGADLVELEKINQNLLKEDLAIMLEGERFLSGKEDNHLHESNDDFMNLCRQSHEILAQRYGWKKVNAMGNIEEVSNKIWQEIANFMAQTESLHLPN